MRLRPYLALSVALALSACAQDSPGDVVGPFTGPTHRFVVDRIDLPTNNAQARESGADLNGDRFVDNQLGMVLSTLNNQAADLNKHGADMIASGVIASSVEIIADDLTNDSTVSVVFHGAERDMGHPMGGTLEGGVFLSNRTATSHALGTAMFHMPLWEDADPAVFQVDNVQLDLLPDGAGGYNAKLNGTVTMPHALAAAYAGVPQMLSARPSSHLAFMRIFDVAPRDWIISEHELETNSLIVSLLSPDVTVGGQKTDSFGVLFHIAPCASGGCTSSPADTCHDRIVDGDETDVDCGGSCGACSTSESCALDADCMSHLCGGDGRCVAPTCSDGIRDGFETDVDCGSECGKTCVVGKQCYADSDCAGPHICGAACPTDQYCPAAYDTCR